MAKKNLTAGSKAAPTGASTTSNLIEIFVQEADKVIVGRVEPRIYAFNTNCVPNALKVGDTYRPVLARLKEWEKYYPKLSKVLDESAFADPDNPKDFTYFRDFSVHDFLESLPKHRLQDKDFQPSVYKSNEFFRDTSKEDVENAIQDIQKAYKKNTRQYQFYTEEGLPAKTTIKREDNYKPRDIQKEAINNFSKALKNKRSNLLMYAVMRFGKTFTAMCCAEKMKAKVVVIVSAKKDVKESWHQIVMGHKKFKGYEFFDADDLIKDPKAISNHLTKSTNNKVAVFLTLQDLSGKGSDGNDIKEKHKELFGNDIKIDLLIVDETHFGARAEQYGKVLQDPKFINDTRKRDNLDDDDFVETSEGDEVVKAFDAKVKLHLSGTPYRILMGSEFEKEDIVAFFQYSDIVARKKEWDEKNMDEDEWKNPYYGFPEMVRFAFNPNKSARDKLEELRKDGYTYALSALLKPKSVNKDSKNDYQIFENEKEVLDLLKVIDGAESDDQLFGFLDYDKLKDGKMCRHIVMVLPYKASCDAMQKLINHNKSKFRNLKDYNIINISGVDVNSSKDVPKCSTICSDVKYNIVKDSLVETVRNIITACEQKGQKTLTLTVNRMLTGCTVPEWDTMLYMKDTSSPQEYDQAIFRLQNPYTKTYCVKDANGNLELDGNGKPKIIKKDMKPQTLLVDFDPMRLFLLQEHKAQIYNINTEKAGNSRLKERIAEDLRISPLLTVDPIDGIVRVDAAKIIEKVSQYHYDRGIREEVDEIPIDMGLYDNVVFRDAIAKENEIGSKAGLSIPAHEGDGTNTKIDTKENETEESKNENATGSKTTKNQPSEEKIWERKLKSYFVKILLYSYLTDDEVNNLQNISDGLDKNDDNRRIANHLGIEKSMLQILLGNINRLGHYEMISRLDYKIQDINKLSHNKKLSVEKQVEVALCKFGKLGDAMVITPANIADDMVALLPDDLFKTKDIHLLDIAATSGEFAMALYRRMRNLSIKDGIIKKSIYSIPKSSICYELTRKVYKLLGLNIDNIAEKFDAFELLKIKDKKNNIDYNKIKQLLGQNKKFSEITLRETTIQNENNMIEFDAIVGNPPYQEITAKKETDNGQKRTKSIFHYFQEVSDSLGRYVSLIYPGGRWIHRSGKGMAEFGLKQINDPHLERVIFYSNADDLFDVVGIADGISVVVKNKNKSSKQFVYEFIENGVHQQIDMPSPGENLIPLNPSDLVIVDKIVKKVKEHNFNYLDKSVLSQKLFSIESDFVEQNPSSVKEYVECVSFDKQTEIKLLTNDKAGKAGRAKWYIAKRDVITTGKEYLDKWKVVVSSANAGGQKRSNQIQVLDNYSAFGRSRVALKTFDTEQEAQNFLAYAKSKFIRFAFLLTDESLTSLAKRVPDIGNYKDNNGIINFKQDIDKQLFDLFEITEQEQNHIQKILSTKKE